MKEYETGKVNLIPVLGKCQHLLMAEKSNSGVSILSMCFFSPNTLQYFPNVKARKNLILRNRNGIKNQLIGGPAIQGKITLLINERAENVKKFDISNSKIN